jgi:hypothetical protein
VDPNGLPKQQSPTLDDDYPDPERCGEHGAQTFGVVDLGDFVPALALLARRLPVVLNELIGARPLLSQLEPPTGGGEVCVALPELASIFDWQLQACRERSRGAGILSLELDIATRCCQQRSHEISIEKAHPPAALSVRFAERSAHTRERWEATGREFSLGSLATA